MKNVSGLIIVQQEKPPKYDRPQSSLEEKLLSQYIKQQLKSMPEIRASIAETLNSEDNLVAELFAKHVLEGKEIFNTEQKSLGNRYGRSRLFTANDPNRLPK